MFPVCQLTKCSPQLICSISKLGRLSNYPQVQNTNIVKMFMYTHRKNTSRNNKDLSENHYKNFIQWYFSFKIIMGHR